MLRNAWFVCVALLLGPGAVGAELPPHLVLARPAGHKLLPHTVPHSRAVKVTAQPYPYGYFGAHSSPHWQRQFGIHRTYTQWGQR